MLPTKPPLVRRSACGAEVRDGGQTEAKPRYRKAFSVAERLWSTPD